MALDTVTVYVSMCYSCCNVSLPKGRWAFQHIHRIYGGPNDGTHSHNFPIQLGVLKWFRIGITRAHRSPSSQVWLLLAPQSLKTHCCFGFFMTITIAVSSYYGYCYCISISLLIIDYCHAMYYDCFNIGFCLNHNYIQHFSSNPSSPGKKLGNISQISHMVCL